MLLTCRYVERPYSGPGPLSFPSDLEAALPDISRFLIAVYHDDTLIHPFVSRLHPVPHPQEAGWSRLSFCNRFPDLPPSCLPPHCMYCTHACIRTFFPAYIYWTTTIIHIRHRRRSSVLPELPASQPTSPLPAASGVSSRYSCI